MYIFFQLLLHFSIIPKFDLEYNRVWATSDGYVVVDKYIISAVKFSRYKSAISYTKIPKFKDSMANTIFGKSYTGSIVILYSIFDEFKHAWGWYPILNLIKWF